MMLSKGNSTTGRRAVTERGIALVIQSVANHYSSCTSQSVIHIIRRTPMHFWIFTLSLSRGINMTITEIRIPIIEPMEAGETIFFENGSVSGTASGANSH